MTAQLTWITPGAEQMIVHMARVSSPASQTAGLSPERLIAYLVGHRHWSPFEMASACFEIDTTRDIARQILRHRSFSFQEFSQRYAKVDALPEAPLREARLQDHANRQSSLLTDDAALMADWRALQTRARDAAAQAYERALEMGIAKEVARAVLPEGLTSSRMYMAGTLRSWLHYCWTRCTPDTQKEHREIAFAIQARLREAAPAIFGPAEETLNV